MKAAWAKMGSTGSKHAAQPLQGVANRRSKFPRRGMSGNASEGVPDSIFCRFCAFFIPGLLDAVRQPARIEAGDGSKLGVNEPSRVCVLIERLSCGGRKRVQFWFEAAKDGAGERFETRKRLFLALWVGRGGTADSPSTVTDALAANGPVLADRTK